MKTRRIEIILGIVLTLVAVGAIPAGLAMILKPDGSIYAFAHRNPSGVTF